jgi:hypothetical protein
MGPTVAGWWALQRENEGEHQVQGFGVATGADNDSI